ncbi:MAG: enoyl-CoA hydratase/isomerase family protein [Caulobacter sp.]|nr:enoyl-CoA hydratase/isomerase family protein [Vitreoscilla sp.]
MTSLDTVLAERRGHVGILTLNRPKALNALSLEMIRAITTQLLAWRDDAQVGAVLLRGANREGKAPAFCAGGDIRYFHEAALAGDPTLEDFFSEEYALNHLIHTFGKPTFVLMDGITMGGGMGLAQGCSLRIVTEHSRLAMPETNIGLFPDVGGGWFLARTPGHLGEFLGLSGHMLGAADALAVDWADAFVPAAGLDELVQAIVDETAVDGVGALSAVNAFAADVGPSSLRDLRDLIDRVFAAPDMPAILAALAAEPGEFAATLATTLAQRSPLMMSVTLEQIRRARTLTLADDLRMERGLVRHCFHLRPGPASETLEGIRALVVDKDHSPRWNPASLDGVDAAMVEAFFASPWPAHAHPLRDLA